MACRLVIIALLVLAVVCTVYAASLDLETAETKHGRYRGGYGGGQHYGNGGGSYSGGGHQYGYGGGSYSGGGSRYGHSSYGYKYGHHG